MSTIGTDIGTGLNRLSNSVGLPEKVCIFGAPLSGKTTLIGELAEKGFHLIFIDVAAEGTALLKLSQAAQDRITYVPVLSTSETPMAHNTVDKLVRGGIFRLCGSHGRVNCPGCIKAGSTDWMEVNIPIARTEETKNTIVVIDNMSTVSQAIACNVQKGKTLIAPIPEMEKETVQRVAEKEAFEDYRIQGAYLNRLLSFIQTSQYHCIVTAHEVEATVESGGTKLVPFIGTTNYSANVSRFFGHVLYTQVVNGKHKVLSTTTSSNKVVCGSRLGLNLDKETVFSIAPIFDGSLAMAASGSASKAVGTSGKVRSTITNHTLEDAKEMLNSILPATPAPAPTPTKKFSLGVGGKK